MGPKLKSFLKTYQIYSEHAEVANEKSFDGRINNFFFRHRSQLRHGRHLRNISSLDHVHSRIGIACVLMNSVYQSLLILTDGLDLPQNNPKTAAKLFHVSQLVDLHPFLKALLLHDDVDELLLTVDAD